MPGGVMEPIADRQRKRIAERLPMLSLVELDEIGGVYRIMRDHHAEAPSSVRDTMFDLAKKANDLHLALTLASEEARHVIQDACYKAGRPTLWEEANAFAALMRTTAMEAFRSVETGDGRPPEARRSLVRQLAQTLLRAGLKADARPKGELCFLTEEILTAYGEPVGSARSIVRNALA